MKIILVSLVSLVSGLLFSVLPLKKSITVLFSIQNNSFRLLKDNHFTDEEKQKLLLVNSGKILGYTLKIVVLIFVGTLPFFLLVFGERWFYHTTHFGEFFLSIEGIVISSGLVILFFLLKAGYAKIRL